MDIDICKVKILKKHPFFGTILYNLPVVELDKDDPELKNMPTMGVDGNKLYVVKEFWHQFDKDPAIQEGLLMHEAGHLFLDHINRGRTKQDVIVADPTSGAMCTLYNLAGDAVINQMIKDNHGKLPANCFQQDRFRDMSTEEVYNILIKEIPPMSDKQKEDFLKKHGGEGFCNKSKWGKEGDGKTKEQADAESAKWKNIGQQAMEYAKQQGKLPAGMDRMFKAMEPKENWRALLREFVENFQDDYSFNPPDRRFMDESFILPEIKEGEKIDYLVVAVDTSGSIGTQELNNFISELKGIMSAFTKVRVKLTFCDADASPFVDLEEFDPAQIKPTGGGGTSFIPPFEMADKEDQKPRALIYFTDLYGDFGKAPTGYEAIWISTSPGMKAPWGKTLDYQIT